MKIIDERETQKKEKNKQTKKQRQKIAWLDGSFD